MLAAAGDARNPLVLALLGKVRNAKGIRKRTRLDIAGYSRGVETYGVKHALKNHGNDARERKRGQIGVTAQDFEKIPRIVGRPDRVTNGGKTRIGRDTLVYERTLDGVTYHYVEEIRPKRRQAVMMTMWKRPAT